MLHVLFCYHVRRGTLWFLVKHQRFCCRIRLHWRDFSAARDRSNPTKYFLLPASLSCSFYISCHFPLFPIRIHSMPGIHTPSPHTHTHVHTHTRTHTHTYTHIYIHTLAWKQLPWNAGRVTRQLLTDITFSSLSSRAFPLFLLLQRLFLLVVFIF